MALSLSNERACYAPLRTTSSTHELLCDSLTGNGMTTFIIAPPKTDEQRPSERQGAVVIVESWLMMLEASDDTDQLLDKLLQDGTARAMREQEIEVAREKRLHHGDSREGTLRSLGLPLRDSVPVDCTVTGGRHRSTTADRIAMRRPNVFLDFAVQDALAGYEIRTRCAPLKLSEPISPASQGP